MASTTRSNGFNYGVQTQPGKNTTRSNGFFYGGRTPDSRTLVNGYTYVPNPVLLHANLLSVATLSAQLKVRNRVRLAAALSAEATLSGTLTVPTEPPTTRRRRSTVYLIM